MSRRQQLRRFARAGVRGPSLAAVANATGRRAGGALDLGPPGGEAPAEVDRFELRIAFDLIPLFTAGDMLDEIQRLREQLASEAVSMPVIRIRDWLDLAPNEFAVLVQGKVILRDTCRPRDRSAEATLLTAIRHAARRNFPTCPPRPSLVGPVIPKHATVVVVN